MKKKGNKKMPRPRQEIIDNPILGLLSRSRHLLYHDMTLTSLHLPSFERNDFSTYNNYRGV